MRILLAAVMTLLATALLLPPLAAAEPRVASSSLRLAVNIPRVMHMTLLGHPHAVNVSADDVARGYIVVSGPRVDIVCNNRGGYVVRAQLTGTAFESAEVTGLPESIRVAVNTASAVAMPSMVGRARPGPAAVEYVLRLARGIALGPQPWPVALALEAP